jgi:hypothetical protein
MIGLPILYFQVNDLLYCFLISRQCDMFRTVIDVSDNSNLGKFIMSSLVKTGNILCPCCNEMVLLNVTCGC